MELVSVIMPAYNAGITIAEAIESVKKQTYLFWELIIINDGSTDNTLSVISLYLNDQRIRLIDSPSNIGLSSARNLGIKHAKGSYIAFLDSDDLWKSVKLSIQMNFHQKNSLILISHTDYELFDQTGIIKRPWKIFSEAFIKKKGKMLPQLYYKNSIGILTAVIKKDLFDQTGLFDTKLWTFEDQDLWIRIASKGFEFGYINQILAHYRISPGGMVKKVDKYKKAYKKLILKYNDQISEIEISNKAWANYYRYFGTVYYKQNNYELASYYFIKAIRLFGVSFNTITTLMYLFLNTFRNIVR